MEQRLTRDGLRKLALYNVVEIRFTRRTLARLPRKRRMLMTLDIMLLNSTLGKKILHFRKPQFAPPYNAASKNLLTVWDIIMQDWRNVPADDVTVTMVYPTRTQTADRNKNLKAQWQFWEYYNASIAKMSPQNKSDFMDR